MYKHPQCKSGCDLALQKLTGCFLPQLTLMTWDTDYSLLSRWNHVPNPWTNSDASREDFCSQEDYVHPVWCCHASHAHMGAHILQLHYDTDTSLAKQVSVIQDLLFIWLLNASHQITSNNSCGFCGLNRSFGCVTILSKKGKMYHSTMTGCSHIHHFSMGATAKSTSATPCTNMPVQCLLCIKPTEAKSLHPTFWRYIPAQICECHQCNHPTHQPPSSISIWYSQFTKGA